ncbi:hypothetical protein CDO73_25360 [Saccharibacillus sp. O23]|uniref:hypothetical protein n=1 Tax=Saccharibacillus sp. O23 TaxID=2009338 RepID=UPI000B4E6CEC|nr:hypothetical protein [Saccharibacillus sp. O23]OWR26604.1 hypothetical protein CDO73_25360 [Saccharibacillus sp. O23]
MRRAELVESLMYFQQYLGKEKIKKQLNATGCMGEKKFENFEETYQEVKASLLESKQSDSKLVTCETLAFGVEKGLITETELDEVLFRVLEDSLMNAYLFKIDSHSIALNDTDAVLAVLQSWGVSQDKKILSNISKDAKGLDFVACSYRVYETDGSIESLRILLLDRELVTLGGKNRDQVLVTYPTLIEFDFLNGLGHIRVKDVDNLETDKEEVGQMSKRIKRTLDHIHSFTPNVNLKEIRGFNKTLYLLEEDILGKKRAAAEERLKDFNESIDRFVLEIESNLGVGSEGMFDTREYISYAVLSKIASTMQQNEQGEIVGIKFRNLRETDTKEYASVHISDRGFKCISTDDVYWFNLPILKTHEKVEELKLTREFSSGGYRVVRLEMALDTANVRMLQRNDHPDKDYHRQPTDEDYLEMIQYLNSFMRPKE